MSDSDQAELHRQRQGAWVISESWVGGTCEFDRQKYLRSLDAFTQEELSAEGFSIWSHIVRIRGDLLEVSRVDRGSLEGRNEWTLAVYRIRFDQGAMGNVDAVPVNWEDEIADKPEFDAPDARHGLYAVNGKKLTIFLTSASEGARPTEIPKELKAGDVLLKIERPRPGQVVPVEADGTWDPNKENFVREWEYVPMAGKTFLESIGSVSPPKPFQYPASKSPKLFVYRRSNGWIAQTEIL